MALALATNLTAAALLTGTIIFYILVYTAWLKRTTRQNIVIGGAAGALPPMIGWAAATGEIGLEPLTPVVAGRTATTRQILIYSSLLVLASELPWVLGFAGMAYGAIAAICGALFLLLAFQLNRSSEADRRAAHRLFVFSITYLFVLFATLLIDHGGGSLWPMRSSHDDRTGASVHAKLLPGAVRSTRSTVNFSEV
jgi:heme O synthase-like polyprenyltransferase